MVLTEMINLAAQIAEQLLVAKDNDSEGLYPSTKLDIIRLAELAATLPDIPEPEPATDIEPEPVFDPEPEAAPEAESASEPEAESAPEPVSDETPEIQVPLPSPHSGEAVAEPPVPVPVPVPAAPQEPAGLVAAEMRRLFSLNDLFLFRRELFQSSQVLFDSALEDVGRCTSAAQARQMLVNDYALDPRRPEAKEFLGVISGLFEV